MKKIVSTIICTIIASTSFSYYQSEEGRWTSRDPIGEKGGCNLYSFNRNNAVIYIDPDGRSPQYVYEGVTLSVDPTTGLGVINLSPDQDWGEWDPRWGGKGNLGQEGESGGVAITFLMATHEFVFDDGCKFYCVSWTPTDVLGISGFGSLGDQQIPVTVSYGVSKHLSVGTSGTTIDGNLGIGVPISPVQVSVRLDCWSIGPDKAKDGCPCKELKPISVMGMSVE